VHPGSSQNCRGRGYVGGPTTKKRPVTAEMPSPVLDTKGQRTSGKKKKNVDNPASSPRKKKRSVLSNFADDEEEVGSLPTCIEPEHVIEPRNLAATMDALTSSEVVCTESGGDLAAQALTTVHKRKGVPPRKKAPSLSAGAIAVLSDQEQRKILGRWNARLRSLKHRVTDISEQFPTSSVVLFCTKPFRLKDRKGRWYVCFVLKSRFH
jgi:hypothetical protein